MRAITLFLVVIVFSSCVSQQRVPTREPNETLMVAPDITILMAEIDGFRLLMTPRKVAQVVKEYGLKESKYNNATLEDLVRANDVKPIKSVEISFERKTASLGLFDYRHLTLGFCGGKVSKVSVRYNVLESNLKQLEEQDRRMFPGMKFEKVEGEKTRNGKYEPVKLMSASIIYIDRGYDSVAEQDMFERRVWVYGTLICLQETIRKNLNY